MPTVQKEANRDVSIDICRIVGTLLVILAHVNIPEFVSELRSFDVILLVLISGICFKGTSRISTYIWKRIKKLVFPTWVLLFFLFGSTFVACIVLGRSQVYTSSQIWRSFLFLEGSIGYIWIVRVYLGIAIIIPFASKVVNKAHEIIVLLAFYLFVECCSFLPEQFLSSIYYVYEAVVYCFIALLGAKIASLDRTRRNRFMLLNIIISGIIFITTVIKAGYSPNYYKYPPAGQYIYYGVFVSIIFVFFASKIKSVDLSDRIKNVLYYCSTNSFNLYLAHIFVLSVLNVVFDSTGISIPWYIYYILLLIISFMVVMVINKVKNYISSCFCKYERK